MIADDGFGERSAHAILVTGRIVPDQDVGDGDENTVLTAALRWIATAGCRAAGASASGNPA